MNTDRTFAHAAVAIGDVARDTPNPRTGTGRIERNVSLRTTCGQQLAGVVSEEGKFATANEQLLILRYFQRIVIKAQGPGRDLTAIQP